MSVSSPRLTNWADTLVTRPAVLVRPETTEDVADFVRNPRRFPSPLRPMGNYCSTTRCVVADNGTVLDMTGMNRILEVGEDFVRAEAGAQYVDVALQLAELDRNLCVDLEIGNITLGSVATCATKDGSFPGGHGEAGAYVREVTLVTAGGELRHLSAEDGELFSAVRSSYGLLGIVVEVTLATRALRPVSVRHRNYSIDGFLDDLPELRQRPGSLAYYLFPFANRVTVQLREEVEPGGRVNRLVWKLRNAGVAYGVPLSARLINLVPLRRVRNGLHRGMNAVARGLLATCLHARRTRPTDQVTRYRHRPRLSRFTFSIWAFEEARFPDVLRAFVEFCRDYDRRHGYRPDLLSVGYRVSRYDGALLSYAHGTDVMTIDPVATGGRKWEAFVMAFNEFCHRHDGRPLLNQSPSLLPEHVQAAFGERLDRFREIRAALDPEGRFLNDHFATLIGDAPTPRARSAARG